MNVARARDEDSGSLASRVSGAIRSAVGSSPLGLVTSRVHLTSLVLHQLAPLTDAEERKVRRIITHLGSFAILNPETGHFPLQRSPRPDGLAEWGRVSGLEGRPIPVGDARWLGVDIHHVRKVLAARLDYGSYEDRRQALEGPLAEGLAAMDFRVERLGVWWASDFAVWVDGVAVNVEVRNRRCEILDRLEARDKKRFGKARGLGVPSVVVAPEVSQRYRLQLASFTKGLGSVVEIGCYIAPTAEVVEGLLELSMPWSPVVGLPDDALEVVAEAIVSAAAGSRAARGSTRVSPAPQALDCPPKVAKWVAAVLAAVEADAELARSQPETARRFRVDVTTLRRRFKRAGVPSPWSPGRPINSGTDMSYGNGEKPNRGEVVGLKAGRCRADESEVVGPIWRPVIGSASVSERDAHDDAGAESDLHDALDWWQLAELEVLASVMGPDQAVVVKTDGSSHLVDVPPSPFFGRFAPRFEHEVDSES